MQAKTSVEHLGVVERVDNQVVRVGFVSHAACSSCQVKGACSLSEVENKFVEVRATDTNYEVGESVRILLEQKLGFKALWYAYVLPLLVLLTTLFISIGITGREGFSGLLSIGILAPYYGILFLFRARLKDQFQFTLKKII